MARSDGAVSNLSDMQDHVLSFISIAPALLSILASCTILYLTWMSGFKTSYKRILFGLAASDIITSVVAPLRPFLVSADTSTRLWASGNDATCAFSGMLTQLTLSTWLYNGVLSFYYLFIIRFGVRESVFARRYEPWMHILAIGYPLVTAVCGAWYKMYDENYIGYGCWVANYPRGCSREDGECQSIFYAWIFMGFWCIFVIIAVAVNNLVIYRHVSRQMQRASRQSFYGERQAQRAKDVAVQAFLYVAAFVGTFAWVWILRVLDNANYHREDEAAIFPLMFLNGILVPSTGFFNLLIYLRPRYMKTRAEFPSESRVWALRRASYGESVPPTAIRDSPYDESYIIDSSKLDLKQKSDALFTVNTRQEAPLERIDEQQSSADQVERGQTSETS